MKITTRICGVAICFGLMAVGTTAEAQGPRDRGAVEQSRGTPIERLMAFDADDDGALTTEEVSDGRLHRLLGRADADGDGKATRDELQKVIEQESAGFGAGRRGPGERGPGERGPGEMQREQRGPGVGGRPGGEDGFGGPPFGGFGPGRGGPPAPGTILPAFLQDELRLTSEQREQLQALQRKVDAELGKILTEEQQQQMRRLGPPPGGPGRGRPEDDGNSRPPRRDRGGEDRPARPAFE